ncbi:MAG: ankyrin repeat domain-containing protein [Verrucomicrobiota bacterium]
MIKEIIEALQSKKPMTMKTAQIVAGYFNAVDAQPNPQLTDCFMSEWVPMLSKKIIQEMEAGTLTKEKLSLFRFEKRDFSKLTASNHQSLLIIAAKHGRTDMVKALIDFGADIEQRETFSGTTAIIQAAGQGHTNTVQALIQSGAKVNVKDFDGYTPLIKASNFGQTKMVRHLINAKADVNAQNRCKVNSLMIAAERGHADIVKALIKAGANVNMRDKDGNTALAKTTHIDIIRDLITAGADVNKADLRGCTPLIKAVGGRYIDIVKILVQAGADIHARNDRGIDAMATAMLIKHKGILEFLENHLEKEKAEPRLDLARKYLAHEKLTNKESSIAITLENIRHQKRAAVEKRNDVLHSPNTSETEKHLARAEFLETVRQTCLLRKIAFDMKPQTYRAFKAVSWGLDNPILVNRLTADMGK